VTFYWDLTCPVHVLGIKRFYHTNQKLIYSGHVVQVGVPR